MTTLTSTEGLFAARQDDAPTIDFNRLAKLSLTLGRHVDVPLERFVGWFDSAPLEAVLKPADGMPGAQGTEPLNAIDFPEPGARRFVFLTDGSRVTEQVLLREPGTFAYQVWGYTNPLARGIAYGHGQFWFRSRGEGTDLSWRYSFALKGNRFPGLLGPAGRLLFRAAFLNGPYRRLMQATLDAIAEGAAAG